jgi:hypothetical protein
MTDEKKLAEDEDTIESYHSWVGHEHTRKRAKAQRIEVESLQRALNGAGLGSTDPNMRMIAAQLFCAQAFLKVLEGKEQ